MRKFVLFIALLSSFGSAVAQGDNDYDSLKYSAYALFKTDVDSAYQIGEQLLSFSIRYNDVSSKIDALIIKAWCLHLKGVNHLAFEQYLLALSEFDAAPELIVEENKNFTLLLRNLGYTGEILQRYDLAFFYFNLWNAFIDKDELNDHAIALFSLAFNNKCLGQYELAQQQALEFLDIIQELDSLSTHLKSLEIGTYHRLAQIAFAQGNQDLAIDFYRYAFESYPDLNDEGLLWRRALAIHNISFVYNRSGMVCEAREWLKNAERFVEESNLDAAYNDLNYLGLIRFYIQRDDFDSALVYAEKFCAIYDDLRLDPNHYAFYEFYAILNYRLGRFEEANAASRQYFEENLLFLEQQDQIVQLHSQFQFDNLIALSKQQHRAAWYELRLLWICVSILFMMIGFVSYRFLVRKKVKKSLLDLQDSLRF